MAGCTISRCGSTIARTCCGPRTFLSENGIFIEAGPSKHNNSQGFYLYSYEPGGNRVEIYSGSYLVFAPDWEPVTWDEEERGTGTYWGTSLPDSFINYATPNVDKASNRTPPRPRSRSSSDRTEAKLESAGPD